MAMSDLLLQNRSARHAGASGAQLLIEGEGYEGAAVAEIAAQGQGGAELVAVERGPQHQGC